MDPTCVKTRHDDTSLVLEGLVRDGRQAGFLTCGSSFPYAFPCAGRTQWLIGRVTRRLQWRHRDGFALSSPGFVALVAEPSSFSISCLCILSSDPTRPVDTCRPSEIVIRYTLFVKRLYLHG